MVDQQAIADEIGRLIAERDGLAARLERAEAAIAAVRELHRRSMFRASNGERRGQYYCVECNRLSSVDDYQAYTPWPCATLRALDGAPTAGQPGGGEQGRRA